MKKETGKMILYQTFCDICGNKIRNPMEGRKCISCGKDICLSCARKEYQGDVYYASFGDIYGEHQFYLCKTCKDNPTEAIKKVITKIGELNEIHDKGMDLFQWIDGEIKEIVSSKVE